jgi:hypothetical protein
VLRSVKPATTRKLDLEIDASLHLSSVKVNREHPAEAVTRLFLARHPEYRDCTALHPTRQYTSQSPL